MKIKYLVFILSFLVMAGVSAQQPKIICGNEMFSDIVRKNFPLLDNAFHSTFESARIAPAIRQTEPLEVNVVVHVVWNKEEENLDDSIILDQMRVLNEDFNRHNADTANLRSLFQSEAGSAGIHFNLAQIIRVQTNSFFEIGLTDTDLLPQVKHDVDGGSDVVDPNHYLNIWICKIQPITLFGIEIGQVLGFAFPPNNLSNWPENNGAPSPEEDGVLIDYRVFGSNNPYPVLNPGTGQELIVKGRTPVHEVGHYFGLRHIWGDGGLLGPNDCAQSDGIDDTPFANAQSAFDCDTTKNTCAQAEVHYSEDVPDLIENYMDYASEGCMNMFTHGQVELMRNILTGPRSGLLTPLSSVAPQINPVAFVLIPNPNEGEFVVQFENTQVMNATVRLSNIQGQVQSLLPQSQYFPGFHNLRFDHLNLMPGVYLIEIRNEDGAFTRKMIVQ